MRPLVHFPLAAPGTPGSSGPLAPHHSELMRPGACPGTATGESGWWRFNVQRTWLPWHDLTSLHRRLDVGVETEEVGRVILVLQGHQPVVGGRAVGL